MYSYIMWCFYYINSFLIMVKVPKIYHFQYYSLYLFPEFFRYLLTRHCTYKDLCFYTSTEYIIYILSETYSYNTVTIVRFVKSLGPRILLMYIFLI